jgi:Protein of unknown function, DUF599
METFNIGAITAAILSLFLYHIFLYYEIIFLNSRSFRLARNVSNAAMWFEKHKVMKDAASVTCAIQTLRNTILVSIFVGGYAFQYGNQSINAINASYSDNDMARAIILSILFYSSFLSWANTIRMASHLGYSIGVLDSYITTAEKKKEVEESMLHVEEGHSLRENKTVDTNQASPSQKTVMLSAEEELEDILTKDKNMIGSMLWSFHFGFRFLYLTIPFAFYSAGPIALVICTFVIIWFLHLIDNVDPYQLLCTGPHDVEDPFGKSLAAPSSDTAVTGGPDNRH